MGLTTISKKVVYFTNLKLEYLGRGVRSGNHNMLNGGPLSKKSHKMFWFIHVHVILYLPNKGYLFLPNCLCAYPLMPEDYLKKETGFLIILPKNKMKPAKLQYTIL